MVDPSAGLILSALRCNHSSSTIFIVARTAAGHSYRNPPEKVNPLLNLDLYCFECMQKEVTVDQYFEKSLDNVSITEQMPSLLKKKMCGTHLLKESCQPCIDLMRDVFFLFSLKGNPVQVKSVILDSEVKQFFQEIGLDQELEPTDLVADLKNQPKLQHYLPRCCKARTYLSVKKCGKADCSTGTSPRLLSDLFENLDHLPNPCLVTQTVTVIISFDDVYKTATEKHLPALKTICKQPSRIPFTLSKQHALNNGTILSCIECNKSQVVYLKLKTNAHVVNFFKDTMKDLLYVSGVNVDELTNKNQFKDLFVSDNLHGSSPIEMLYHFINYNPCCTYCGCTR